MLHNLNVTSLKQALCDKDRSKKVTFDILLYISYLFMYYTEKIDIGNNQLFLL